MDIAISVLALLCLTTLLVILVVSRKPSPTKQDPTRKLAVDTYEQRLLTDQILENRRLMNYLLTLEPWKFHAVTAMNPEMQGKSPLVDPNLTLRPDPFLGSETAQGQDVFVYPEGEDEGFDGSFGNIPR